MDSFRTLAAVGLAVHCIVSGRHHEQIGLAIHDGEELGFDYVVPVAGTRIP